MLELLLRGRIWIKLKAKRFNSTKLENLLHRIFEPARLDIEIMDRFGRPVVPREWFLVPLFVIKEVAEKIKDGTIADYIYDTKRASLKNRGSSQKLL